MKRIIWAIGLVVGLYMCALAQVNMQQVEKVVQSAVDKQDCQIHDIYTESYLKEISQGKKTLEIVRNGQDWRELKLLGDSYRFQKAEALAGRGETDFMNTYVNPRAKQSITVRIFTEKRTVKEILSYMKDLFDTTNFTLETYDLLKVDEGMISFTRKKNDGKVDYMVFRVFKGTDGEIFFGKVSRTLGSYNVKVMQGIFHSLKQTDKETLTAYFVKDICQMGSDCY